MLIILLTFFEAALIALLCMFLFNLTLWLEILLSVLIGIVTALVLRVAFFYIQIAVAAHFGPRCKFTKGWADAMVSFLLVVTNVRYKIIGLENVPDGPCVLCPNHKSLLDFFTMYQSRKEVMAFVGKIELISSKFINRYKNVVDVIYIDRSNDRAAAESLITAIRKLKNGEKVVIFPEGLRTDPLTNCMLEGRAGSYKVPLKAKVPIIPVSIRNNNLISKRAPWKRTKLEIIYHEPISYEDYKDMNTHEIEEMVRKAVNSSFEE